MTFPSNGKAEQDELSVIGYQFSVKEVDCGRDTTCNRHKKPTDHWPLITEDYDIPFKRESGVKVS